jgi:hypothetical protein
MLFAVWAFACSKNVSNARDRQQDKSDQEVLEQVRTFATDEGSLGQEAWVALTRNNRENLVNSLHRLLRSTSLNALDKCSVAFVLCNLDVDYKENSAFVVANFNQSLENASSLERLISRLVDRGDSDLLVPLLAMSVKADGDFSEGLADTFAKQMETQPGRFLTLVKEQPDQIRHRVYDLIAMGSSDSERIKKYLLAVPKDSQLWPVAKEMLAAISKS